MFVFFVIFRLFICFYVRVFLSFSFLDNFSFFAFVYVFMVLISELDWWTLGGVMSVDVFMIFSFFFCFFLRFPILFIFVRPRQLPSQTAPTLVLVTPEVSETGPPLDLPGLGHVLRCSGKSLDQPSLLGFLQPDNRFQPSIARGGLISET
jgi:hypothetical protein